MTKRGKPPLSPPWRRNGAGSVGRVKIKLYYSSGGSVPPGGREQSNKRWPERDPEGARVMASECFSVNRIRHSMRAICGESRDPVLRLLTVMEPLLGNWRSAGPHRGLAADASPRPKGVAFARSTLGFQRNAFASQLARSHHRGREGHCRVQAPLISLKKTLGLLHSKAKQSRTAPLPPPPARFEFQRCPSFPKG